LTSGIIKLYFVINPGREALPAPMAFKEFFPMSGQRPFALFLGVALAATPAAIQAQDPFTAVLKSLFTCLHDQGASYAKEKNIEGRQLPVDHGPRHEELKLQRINGELPEPDPSLG